MRRWSFEINYTSEYDCSSRVIHKMNHFKKRFFVTHGECKKVFYNFQVVMVVTALALLMANCDNQHDENRTGFGSPLSGLTEEELNLFEIGFIEFSRDGTVDTGLGPVFNDISCAQCHIDPEIGGTDNSRTIVETQIGTEAEGVFDPLEDLGGPLIQNRGVGEEIEGCPTGEVIPNQAVFVSTRQIPPVFGAGLIEAIPDEVILENADPDDLDNDGISGRANFSSSGRITRFGWKANIPDLDTFSGVALLMEMGITNPFDIGVTMVEQLPQGQPIPEGCDLLEEPESEIEVVEAIAAFQRFLAPPPRGSINNDVILGQEVFNDIGCAKCHTPSLQTGVNEVEALRNKDVELFSDLLLHDMGEELADGIESEDAKGNEFRTAPLWGLGVRNFFLHDGRTDSLEEAIEFHGGESKEVRDSFSSLSEQEVEVLLIFLKSL